MRPRREMMALLITAVVIVASLLAFFVVDIGGDPTPVQRTEQQNSGANAPSDTLPSPGTVKDAQGDPALPPGQQ
jgi:hypothetical protein